MQLVGKAGALTDWECAEWEFTGECVLVDSGEPSSLKATRLPDLAPLSRRLATHLWSCAPLQQHSWALSKQQGEQGLPLNAAMLVTVRSPEYGILQQIGCAGPTVCVLIQAPAHKVAQRLRMQAHP